MVNHSKKSILNAFQDIIESFEEKKFTENGINKNMGAVYTPVKIADFLVKNAFIKYFKDLMEDLGNDLSEVDPCGFNLMKLSPILDKNPNLKSKLFKKIESIKTLDPACGSGRLLISIGNYLKEMYRIIFPELNDFEIKKKIIQNNIYGIEIDKSAHITAKLKLLTWLYSEDENRLNFCKKPLRLEELDHIFDDIDVKFNIFNQDFLLEFDTGLKFNLIVGNPPYVENKKMKDRDFKQKLYKNFKSAYKLFDLSIVFIEKSLELMEDADSYLSFLITNKFLSADDGIKIREILLNNTKLREIINISSLPIFAKKSIYPIIITLKKEKSNEADEILIKKYHDLKGLIEEKDASIKKISQDFIKQLPSKVIPIAGNIELVRFLYTNYKPMSESIPDLRIIYRPFGFTKWARFFDNVYEKKQSKEDLILIGTGNVGKYHLKTNKRIRIAGKDIKVSYFKYDEKFEEKWQEMNKEKLIFREVAKEMTWIYDPGSYTNITGLYLVRIPSFNTNELFSLLTVLNSSLMDVVFKTLFGTLHMSGGYLRFNGSFIKRLPMPNEFPLSLSYLGRILSFLSQLIYDNYPNSELNLDLFNYFNDLCDSLVNILFIRDEYKNLNFKFETLSDLLYSDDHFPKIKVEKLLPPPVSHASEKDLDLILTEIINLYKSLSNNSSLTKELRQLANLNYLL